MSDAVEGGAEEGRLMGEGAAGLPVNGFVGFSLANLTFSALPGLLLRICLMSNISVC